MKRLLVCSLVVVAAGCDKSEGKPVNQGAGAATPAAGAPPPTAAEPSTPPAASPAAPPDGAAKASPAGSAPCTAEAVRQARRDAERHLQRRDYEAAASALDELRTGCVLSPGEADRPNLDFFWVASDRSFVAYKAGDHVGCLRILSPLTTPKPPLSIHQFGLADSKVGKAILHNEELCSKGHAGQRKEFQAPPCSLGGGGTAIGLPAELLPAGAQSACLVLEEGPGPESFRQALESGNISDPKLCGGLILRTKRAGGAAPEETRLSATGGPLTDTTACCTLNELAIAATGGKRVRVKGWGRDCFGGTAESEYDAIYSWEANVLTLVEDDEVASH